MSSSGETIDPLESISSETITHFFQPRSPTPEDQGVTTRGKGKERGKEKSREKSKGSGKSKERETREERDDSPDRDSETQADPSRGVQAPDQPGPSRKRHIPIREPLPKRQKLDEPATKADIQLLAGLCNKIIDTLTDLRNSIHEQATRIGVTKKDSA